MSKTKKRLTFLACAIIAIAVAFSCLSFNAQIGNVNADELIKESSPVTIAGGQFNDSSSGVVTSPSNWTGSYKGNYKGNVISGVVDLGANSDTASFDEFMKATKLSDYPEFESEKPSTPFGRNTTKDKEKWYFPASNSKALMINTNDTQSKAGTVYGYASNIVELTANSFYKFSVWAKTGSFQDNRGAVIKLSGFEHDIGFWNIDTWAERDNADLGFCEYVIYVATAQNTVSAVINLQIGDKYEFGEAGKDDYYFAYTTPSSGYAFFDNVTCEQLSPNAFYEATEGLEDNVPSGRKLVKDFNTSSATSIKPSKVLTTESGEIGSFEHTKSPTDKMPVGWTQIYKEDRSFAAPLYMGVYDAGKAFDSDNIIGLSSNPYTPKGNREIVGERNILVLAADEKRPTNIGFESEEFTIERNKFYRVSVWANSQNFDSSSNAAMTIVGENNIASDNFELYPVTIGEVSGSGNINARYGWNKYFFYIRGSMVKNRNVKLQLWLGYDSNCTGTVLFDDVRFEELSYSYFNTNYNGGTLVTFDKEPSTSINNGRFFNAENYGEEYPLRPTEWTTIGEKTDNGVSGIILTDSQHYNENANKYFNVNNPVPQDAPGSINAITYPSMLLLASREKGYFGYSSPNLTIVTNSTYKITVTMRTIDMTDSGANLWLEWQGLTIASVKNIKSTATFTTYEFYVQGDKAFESGTGIDYAVSLKIALGRENKPATGSIYVAEAAMTTIGDEEFTNKYDFYKKERGTNINYDMYSFSELNFFGYDNTDDKTLKTSTNWTATDGDDAKYEMGVFDPYKKESNGGAYIPDEITYAYRNLKDKFDQVFAIQARDTAVVAQLTNPIKVEANSYYNLSVVMAVIIHDGNNSDKSQGAGLYLNATSYSENRFTNIRTTDNIKDKYEFREFRFYIATGEEPTNLYLRVTLGDINDPLGYVSGDVYIAYIGLTNLNRSDDTLKDSDTLRVINNHVDENDEDGENNNDANAPESNGGENGGNVNPTDNERWWLIPSILFGVAILLAVGGVVVRTIIDKVSRKQRSKGLNSYDRRIGYIPPEEEENATFDDDATKNNVVEQDIDEFDDDETTTSEPTEQAHEERKQAPKKPESDVNDDFDE